MKKHIAKTNTDQRCVVLFMQIPGREDHALVCPVDALPDRIEQAVMSIVESAEGQSATVLANVMGRRMLPDTGENVMEALHKRNYLTPIPIDNVFMLPRPNMPFPLRDIIEQMGGTVPTARQTPVSAAAENNRFNPYGDTGKQEQASQDSGTAANLIAEAQLLEEEARIKRARAYRISPELAPVEPVVVSEPGVTDPDPNPSGVVDPDKPAPKRRNKKTLAE